MPVKQRFPKPRKPQFSSEVLALFRELEGMRKQERKSQRFKDGEHKLALLLGLELEWWGGSFCVVNCEPHNPFRPWKGGYEWWQKCKEIRGQLLTAASDATPAPRLN
jgi:hypothetical protein